MDEVMELMYRYDRLRLEFRETVQRRGVEGNEALLYRERILEADRASKAALDELMEEVDRQGVDGFAVLRVLESRQLGYYPGLVKRVQQQFERSPSAGE